SACVDDPALVPGENDAGTRRCLSDDDCPDRFACNVAVGICFARDECGPDIPCPLDNQICETGPQGDRVCVFERCTADSACGDLSCDGGQVPRCVAGGCVCGTPCQGGCPAGEGCCVVSDTCEPLPAPCQNVTCGPGEVLAITSEGAWSAGTCSVQGQVCTCEPLPPLSEGDIGLYSAIAHDRQSPVISAYNRDYGDLMFGRVADDGRINWAFIDGVPTSTTGITGDVRGPRGGNSTPGPDVGLYTDIAIDSANRAHIVFHDRDRGALKYAVASSAGWQIHTVDGAGPGTTGLYASLDLDPEDRPVVAYLSAREGPDNGGRRSVLKLARARIATPQRIEDWTRIDVDAYGLSTAACRDRCNRYEVCRASDQVCVPTDTPAACVGCSSNEACVGGVCIEIEPPPVVRSLPRARGLWPSVAVNSRGDVLVAYRDGIDKNLRLVRVTGPDLTGSIERRVVEGFGGPLTTDDTGFFASLFVTPGDEIHLAYMNATRRSLRYVLLGDDLAPILTEEVDRGLSTAEEPDGQLIGADAALVVLGPPTSAVGIAYQDATRGDLRYATRQGESSWQIRILAGNEASYAGSFGFYADQTIEPSRRRAVVSTYRFFLEQTNGVVVFEP
ncbi:MAG: hypothetical protein AAF449_13295, partial [Myxococcota bacterium]